MPYLPHLISAVIALLSVPIITTQAKEMENGFPQGNDQQTVHSRLVIININ